MIAAMERPRTEGTNRPAGVASATIKSCRHECPAMNMVCSATAHVASARARDIELMPNGRFDTDTFAAFRSNSVVAGC